MFHWSRLGVPRGREEGLPFLCARGVCVLPLLIPVSWETGARRTRDLEWESDFKTVFLKNLEIQVMVLYHKVKSSKEPLEGNRIQTNANVKLRTSNTKQFVRNGKIRSCWLSMKEMF